MSAATSDWIAAASSGVVSRIDAALPVLLASGRGAAAADGEGLSALHHAAERGHAAAARRLLALGVPVDVRGRGGHSSTRRVPVGHEHVPLRDFTPLHAAALAGHSDVVVLLLTHGADPDAADRSRLTALHCAAAAGRAAPRALRSLLEAGCGCCLDARSASNATPLDVARQAAARARGAEQVPANEAMRLLEAEARAANKWLRAARRGDAGALRGCVTAGAAPRVAPVRFGPAPSSARGERVSSLSVYTASSPPALLVAAAGARAERRCTELGPRRFSEPFPP
ncbi:hypothetical protein EMIHUDRAFT_432981 [Emiliania huxleyi CCMP1516]|uniref:Uncharacterized protein n=2 Tax=Emiliania huxleyi TaxID=2903 RepID=A0A0D3I760_EMIH1|nr:hypothetical protein EMIHUDRAFT_432981 [Emiliania huxleyi CCMP1516]EOD07095.1 hypothetical protein EMIHUDRAFT_432981 [Emiliania huxleyi CCMP1516]|eukprot:XP_005759524.1 hypothetical protein EMIHUDRAFT_432981 [Emiliania huxleyi CCMP1516]